MSYLIVYLNRTHVFEECMVRLHLRTDTQQKDVIKRNWVHAQNSRTTLDSIVNKIKGKP